MQWYGIINDSMTDKTITLRQSMNMRASALRKFLYLLILNLLFPSIFCWYFRYFVSETYIFSGLQLHLHTINAVSCHYLWYGTIIQYADKTIILRKLLYMRASAASELRNICIFTFKNCYFFQYFVGTSETLSVQMTYLSAYNVPTDFQMYRQNSEKAVGGIISPPPPPPSGYASALPYVLSLV